MDDFSAAWFHAERCASGL